MHITRTTILTCTPTYHHLPDHAERIVREGMSLRDALAALRKAGRKNFGNIGGMSCDLSDGSRIAVDLQSSTDGTSRLMSSQRIERRCYDTDELIRVYSW